LTSIIKHSASLYIATVVIWGSTFYAIKFQLGVVAAEVSIMYRFGLASILLLLFCLITKKNLRYSPAEHLFIFLQGVFLFSINYFIVYWVTDTLTSGIVALIFSTVILSNIVNGAIFLRTPVSFNVIFGACIGILGVAAIFWSEVSKLENDNSTWRALWFCLFATYLASLGNILSARNQLNQLPILQTNALGMGYGALILFVYALYQGADFNYDPRIEYTLSLLYLCIFGSIFAFGSYLTLIGRIGADKTAYMSVLFPVVALSISTVFENYHWSMLAICGFALTQVGNYLVLKTTRTNTIES
jgi:drug/metabolite transporter (DMT)-like permease